jgi:hypothetical protein
MGPGEEPRYTLLGVTGTFMCAHLPNYSLISTGIHKKEPSSKIGKNIKSLSTEFHTDSRPMYNGVALGSPRGSLTTVLLLPQCHVAFGTIPSTLAHVDQSPVSQFV